MSQEILTLQPEFGLEEAIEFRTLITEMESGKERTRAKWPYGLRSYRLKIFAYTRTAMNTIWDFFIARKGAYDPFLVKLPPEYQIVDEAIGTGDGVKVDFVLDEFPVDTSANFEISVNGSPVSATLHNNFTGEFSYATIVAPTCGQTVTGSYEFYFYMRFMEDKFSRTLIAYRLLEAGLELREVRWETYRPRAGNTNLIKGSVSDAITINENVAKILMFNPYKTDSVTIVENITTFTDIYHRSVYDSVSIAESITVAIP